MKERLSTPAQKKRHIPLLDPYGLQTPPLTDSPCKKVWHSPTSGTHIMSSSPTPGPVTPSTSFAMQRHYPTPTSVREPLPRLFGHGAGDASVEVPDSQAHSSESKSNANLFHFSPRTASTMPLQSEYPSRAARTSPSRPNIRDDDMIVPSSQPDELDVTEVPPLESRFEETGNDEVVPTSQSQEWDLVMSSPRRRTSTSGSSTSQSEIVPTSQASEEEWPTISYGTSNQSPVLERNLPQSIATFLERTRHWEQKMREATLADSGRNADENQRSAIEGSQVQTNRDSEYVHIHYALTVFL